MTSHASARLKIAPFLFISPFFIAYAIFGLYPILYGFWLSLMKGTDSYTFAGLSNYLFVFKDGFFWKAMWNGTKLALGSLFLILPVALGVSLLLNRPYISKKKGFFATFFFTPNITSAVAVGIIFKLLLERDSGFLNSILGVFGVDPIGWLKDPAWTIPALIILCGWKYLGVNILFFLAGLQNVPNELIEAAKIDGATPAQRLWYVTMPLLRPIMTFIVFQCLLGSYGMFSEAFILANSGFGPENSLVFPTSYLYDQAFRRQDFTYSSALGYVFTLMMLVIGFIQLKMFNLKDQEG
ncbi:carbohydrate ABC transporter permease [Paenibacillus montanisoli]|uniref:Sugar ABC transporter permease n=1 Tax=Paenibacillus montanisoli TaxID=2081970 RepID=A0A328TXJ8_9BACL|nr:sugar ABC transporter permease [Paenibacillus montanisoli]RAP75207.1 sugar ABC transporter permease [Paenibacillus montanisoli]